MASPEYEQFYRALKSKPLVDPHQPIIALRAGFEKNMRENFPSLPDVRYEQFSIGKIPATWILPQGTTREKIILFFFGGGYNSGSARSHSNFLGRFAKAADAAILAIDYRLAPENPFPAALEDALLAYQWLLHHPYAPGRIVISGGSAGGGLAIALLLKIKQMHISSPMCAVCFSPWLDLTLSGKSIKENAESDCLNGERVRMAAEMYCGKNDPKNPLISPLYANLEGLPPIFIQVGGKEILLSENLEFFEKAKDSGLNITLDLWDEMIHNFPLFAEKFPEGEEGIQRAAEFISEHFINHY